MATLRVLFDPAACGPWNMAVDEGLLETAAATGLATLRFYAWTQPTVSVGYFQSIRDRQQHSASRDCPLVRRATGGGAIVHDRELTYSLALPSTTSKSAQHHLYQLLHQSLVKTLRTLGIAASLCSPAAGGAEHRGDPPDKQPFLCFERRTPGDVLCGDSKIAGSAQRRRRGSVLQHGSILLAASRCAPHLLGIQELRNQQLMAAELAACWEQEIASCLNLSAIAGELSSLERCRARELEAARFASKEFTERR
jgi:lipoyl(octanoyl) transferase